MDENAYICGLTIAYGNQRWRRTATRKWQTLMFGSHGPSVGLSWKWRNVSSEKVPDNVKEVAEKPNK